MQCLYLVSPQSTSVSFCQVQPIFNRFKKVSTLTLGWHKILQNELFKIIYAFRCLFATLLFKTDRKFLMLMRSRELGGQLSKISTEISKKSGLSFCRFMDWGIILLKIFPKYKGGSKLGAKKSI